MVGGRSTSGMIRKHLLICRPSHFLVRSTRRDRLKLQSPLPEGDIDGASSMMLERKSQLQEGEQLRKVHCMLSLAIFELPGNFPVQGGPWLKLPFSHHIHNHETSSHRAVFWLGYPTDSIYQPCPEGAWGETAQVSSAGASAEAPQVSPLVGAAQASPPASPPSPSPSSSESSSKLS